jgi:hypothetical protein
VGRHHVALLALFVALGGTAAAATYISGTRIKPRSIPENRLAPKAAAAFKASEPAVYCAAARAKPRTYSGVPCRSRSEVVGSPSSASIAIVIGTDGNPYVTFGGHPTQIARCNDPICASGGETISDVNGTYFSVVESLAIASTGFPIVSEWYAGDGPANAYLAVFACNNINCADNSVSGGPVDTALGVGKYSSLAIGANGNPIISYYDETNGNLKVARCNDPVCVGSDETANTVDSASADVGWFTSLAIGTDGNPVIAYYDATNADLKVARCNDPACAGGNETISVVDSAALVGKFASLAIGADGNPVIAYYDETSHDLKVARCNDKACSGGNETRTPVDTSGDVGTHASLAIGLDAKPVVAYYDATNGNLKLARCNDLACAGQNESLATLDSGGDVGLYASIAIGLDGVPVVAYMDSTNGVVKVGRPSILL